MPPQSWTINVRRSIGNGVLQQFVKIRNSGFEPEIILVQGRLVGKPAAHVVRYNHAMASAQSDHQVSKKKGPGGIAMHHNHG